ncbi:MAG: diaminopimelate decarboxylase [Bacteroidaceae bacterium]|nr:diaminopimelate decarboxylase [Bacteroidaceae bacterium]
MKGTFPIERFKDIDTPFYYYDTRVLRETLDTIHEETRHNPEYEVHYAIKANANPKVLRIISAAGFGADCVSGGEVRAAIEAGFPANKVVFAGVGKSDREINLALDYGIHCFNVESEAELLIINELAEKKGKVARIALRINPNVGAHTHSNITTGLAENKFGINLEQIEGVIEQAIALPYIDFEGVHFHIGSQILDMIDFVALCNRVNELTELFERRKYPIRSINVGGGLGIDYGHPNHKYIPDFHSYFEVFRKHLRLQPGQTLHFELGRSIVAQCGSLISRVLYIKEGTCKRFAIIDGSMTELIRPALYQAYHRIENISSDEPEMTYDVVGPVCESSDVFGKAVDLNATHRGDFIAIRSAGAYGEVMASQYNCHELPKGYLSDELC